MKVRVASNLNIAGFGGKQEKSIVIGSYYMLDIIEGKTAVPVNAIVVTKRTKEISLYVDGTKKSITKQQFTNIYESVQDSKDVPESITRSLGTVQTNIESFVRRL